MLLDVYPDGSFDCVICDFGYASVIGETRPEVKGFDVPTNTGLTPKFAAPEVTTSIVIVSYFTLLTRCLYGNKPILIHHGWYHWQTKK